MSKSIKYADGYYLDSSSVSHNKVPLNEMLNPIVLYDNPSGSVDDITLNRSIDDFNYLEIFYVQYQGYQSSIKIDLSINNKITLIASVWLNNQSTYNGIYIDTKELTVENNKILVNSYGTLYYNETGYKKEQQNNIKILKVIGYK